MGCACCGMLRLVGSSWHGRPGPTCRAACHRFLWYACLRVGVAAWWAFSTDVACVLASLVAPHPRAAICSPTPHSINSVSGPMFFILSLGTMACCSPMDEQKVMAKGDSIKNVGKKMGLMKAKTAQHAELNGDPFSV